MNNWSISLFEAIILCLAFLIASVLVVGSINDSKNFERRCAESGGSAVWDGRQYQCLKSSN